MEISIEEINQICTRSILTVYMENHERRAIRNDTSRCISASRKTQDYRMIMNTLAVVVVREDSLSC